MTQIVYEEMTGLISPGAIRAYICLKKDLYILFQVRNKELKILDAKKDYDTTLQHTFLIDTCMESPNLTEQKKVPKHVQIVYSADPGPSVYDTSIVYCNNRLKKLDIKDIEQTIRQYAPVLYAKRQGMFRRFG